MSEDLPEPEPLTSVREIRRLRERRERTATWIALGLITLLGLTIFGLFGFAFARDVDGATDLAQVLLPALVTLVGTVLGYYFGSQPDPPPD